MEGFPVNEANGDVSDVTNTATLFSSRAWYLHRRHGGRDRVGMKAPGRKALDAIISSSAIEELVGVQHDRRTTTARFNTANVLTNPVLTGAGLPWSTRLHLSPKQGMTEICSRQEPSIVLTCGPYVEEANVPRDSPRQETKTPENRQSFRKTLPHRPGRRCVCTINRCVDAGIS